MATFSIKEAKEKFSALVQRAKRGETVIITDRRSPVALISPYKEEKSVAEPPKPSDLPNFEQALSSLPHALDF